MQYTKQYYLFVQLSKELRDALYEHFVNFKNLTKYQLYDLIAEYFEKAVKQVKFSLECQNINDEERLKEELKIIKF